MDGSPIFGLRYLQVTCTSLRIPPCVESAKNNGRSSPVNIPPMNHNPSLCRLLQQKPQPIPSSARICTLSANFPWRRRGACVLRSTVYPHSRDSPCLMCLPFAFRLDLQVTAPASPRKGAGTGERGHVTHGSNSLAGCRAEVPSRDRIADLPASYTLV